MLNGENQVVGSVFLLLHFPQNVVEKPVPLQLMILKILNLRTTLQEYELRIS
jgi:hypothetical protein